MYTYVYYICIYLVDVQKWALNFRHTRNFINSRSLKRAKFCERKNMVGKCKLCAMSRNFAKITTILRLCLFTFATGKYKFWFWIDSCLFLKQNRQQFSDFELINMQFNARFYAPTHLFGDACSRKHAKALNFYSSYNRGNHCGKI